MKLTTNNRVAPFLLALLGRQSTSTSSAQQVDRPECGNQTDCLSCMSEDCAWTIGECMSWCQVADVECYRLPDDKNSSSPQDVCNQYVNDEADSSLCGSQSDCSSCVGTVKSDNKSTCQWFADGNGFCASGCNMIGCGVDTCEDDGGNRLVVPEGVVGSSCDQEDCLSCLESSCVWTGGSEYMCDEECIADGSCFYPAEWNNMSATQACADATNAQEDEALCNSQTDCTGCVAAKQSDDRSCMWFEESGSCETACNQFECGVTTCEELGDNGTTSGCEGNDDCLSCLTSDCVWTDSQCMASCDVMDIACYQVSADRTAQDVCDVADTAEEDFDLCDGKTDCTSCVAATKSDGSSCLWSGEGEGYCASECGMGPCGSPTCDAPEAEVTVGPACDEGDCVSCLEADCVWTDSTCMSSCDMMDIACYQVSDNETASDVCDVAAADKADMALCRGNDNCTSCMETEKSDGGYCMWFPSNVMGEVGTCTTGCADQGCGVATCGDDEAENVEARGVGSSGAKGFLSAALKLGVVVTVVFFSW